MAPGERSEAGRGANVGDHCFQRTRLRRRQAAPVDVLRGSAHAETGGGGRRVRSPRRTGLPYGERVVFSQDHRVVGRGHEDDQKLKRTVAWGSDQWSTDEAELATFG